jgi:hypothetical protein
MPPRMKIRKRRALHVIVDAITRGGGHLMMRRGRKIAKVAMARRLAIALYWMWRRDYEQVKKFGSHGGQLGTGRGVQ